MLKLIDCILNIYNKLKIHPPSTVRSQISVIVAFEFHVEIDSGWTLLWVERKIVQKYLTLWNSFLNDANAFPAKSVKLVLQQWETARNDHLTS